MRHETLKSIQLAGRTVDYRLINSNSAKKLRVRVGLGGVEVVHPVERSPLELQTFLEDRQEWIFQQLDRIERMQRVRRPLKRNWQEILFNGIATPVKIEENRTRRTNKVVLADGCITIYCGIDSTTKPATSLENWLRRQAREKIHLLLEVLMKRISKNPGKVYIMGQRTKWGNCSSLQNLSFNWRLIMAPEYVVRYLVTHEAVHLEVPDHSKRFWLTVQSICPEMDRARQWLSANSHRMMVDLDKASSLGYK
jgi:predicted metal-dependent hydrolase